MSKKISLTEPQALDLSQQNTERCLFSFKVINRARRTACCLPCFCSIGLINKVQSFEIYITHHLTNGSYHPWPCIFCLKDTIQVRRMIDCPHCLNNRNKVLKHLTESKLDVQSTHYMFDNFHEKFEYLKPLVTNLNTEHV